MEPQSTSGSYTTTTDYRVEAVDQVVELYKGKTAPNLKDFNDNFMDLVEKLNKFYGSNKELS